MAEQMSWVNPGSVNSAERAPPPIVGSASMTRTERCARAIVMAAARPLGPEPMTMASNERFASWSCGFSGMRSFRRHFLDGIDTKPRLCHAGFAPETLFMIFNLRLCSVLLLLVFTPALQPIAIPQDKPRWPTEVEQALGRAEKNREQLERALSGSPSDQRKGMEFLVDN